MRYSQAEPRARRGKSRRNHHTGGFGVSLRRNADETVRARVAVRLTRARDLRERALAGAGATNPWNGLRWGFYPALERFIQERFIALYLGALDLFGRSISGAL